jgi:predicted ABC-type ATPase
MTDDRHIQLDLNAEVESYFDASSECENKQPVFAMVMGGPAAGKTTTRRQKFSKGYVLVDAADIFIRLSKGQSLDFPDDLKEPMEIVGAQIARRAVTQRRHIVTELIGADYESTVQLIEAMRSIGYEISLNWVNCDVGEAMRRNLARGNDNISCYFAEEFQRRWLIEAAER